jgi:hypothetical protein
MGDGYGSYLTNGKRDRPIRFTVYSKRRKADYKRLNMTRFLHPIQEIPMVFVHFWSRNGAGKSRSTGKKK